MVSGSLLKLKHFYSLIVPLMLFLLWDKVMQRKWMFPILISCVPMPTVFHLTSLKVSLSLLPSYTSTSSLRLTQYKWLHLKCWASVRCCFKQLCSNPHKKTLKRANINVEQSSSVLRIWKRISIGILSQDMEKNIYRYSFSDSFPL